MFRKLALLAAFVFFAFGNINAQSTTELCKGYTIHNATGVETVTYISTSTIVPGRTRILGFTVQANTKNTFSSYAALWDLTSTTTWSVSSLLGESESLVNETRDKIFPYPKTIAYQLKVVLGPYSSITIEYTK
jgi:alanyl-tRNA synthetase